MVILILQLAIIMLQFLLAEDLSTNLSPSPPSENIAVTNANESNQTISRLEQLEKTYPWIKLEPDYQKNKKILKYDTYQNQLKILKSIVEGLKQIPDDPSSSNSLTNQSAQSSNQTLTKQTKINGYQLIYTQLLESTFQTVPNDPFRLFLIEWVSFFNLTNKLNFLKHQLETPTKRKRSIDIIIKQKTLEGLSKMSFSNQQDFADLFFDFFKNPDLNSGHREIKQGALKGLKKLLPDQFHTQLKMAFDQEKNSEVKRNLLEVITAYRDPVDVPFLKETINREKSIYLKRSYIKNLTNYASNQMAQKMILDLYRDKDIRIAKQALSVLGHYPMDYRFYLEAGKNDKKELRLEAIKQLGQDRYQTEEVNDYLKFKAESDESSEVKKYAIKILSSRGLWKNEKPK